MEAYKEFDKITEIDERHQLMGKVTGGVLNLQKLYSFIEQIHMNASVPEHIRGQFNVARNMTLYTYFCYSLAPEVHMKTYSVMEMALRTLYPQDKNTPMAKLVKKVFADGVITDAGFRHVPDDPENIYCKKFVDVFPKLRNMSAHGTTLLTNQCVGHLEKCADFVNQLFPPKN